MTARPATPTRVQLPAGQVVRLLGTYAWSRLRQQIKTVAPIVCYLVVFQLVVLDVPVARAAVVTLGIGIVLLGLALFMEGLFLGLMPLGEACGVRLPQKTAPPLILGFALVLGLGATFAEPAIGVLRAAGMSVRAWDAPLLYLLLNKHAGALVGAVGIGVGVAVLCGMLRFLRGWSLKPFIYAVYGLAVPLSVWAYFEPNMLRLTGLAWDCGAVTTGPVTVPLVLALGIGITRVVALGAAPQPGGFGVVTLASAFPVVAVLLLGAGVAAQLDVPEPMSDVDFCRPANRPMALALFRGEAELTGYVLQHGSPAARVAYFGDQRALDDYVVCLAASPATQAAVFGGTAAYERWVLATAGLSQKLAVFGSAEQLRVRARALAAQDAGELHVLSVAWRQGLAAFQAIVPLSLFLVLVLYAGLRERVHRTDEVVLGIVMAVLGMSLFSMGIEVGLSRLGSDVGANLPASFRAVELVQQQEVISDFDPSVVAQAIADDGSLSAFFHRRTPDGFQLLPFEPQNYDASTRQYLLTPVRGPLFAEALGILVVILFGFMMGYGATLAEPALNALGTTVEELTVGTFHKSMLMHAVAIGVGAGIALGVIKVIFDWPLIALLVPSYAALLLLTALSEAQYVEIGWDSAGVTTGPVTVPLVLAMGLGIGGQMGSVEGFGVLAMASVCPVLAVLLMGLRVTRRRRAEMADTPLA